MKVTPSSKVWSKLLNTSLPISVIQYSDPNVSIISGISRVVGWVGATFIDWIIKPCESFGSKLHVKVKSPILISGSIGSLLLFNLFFWPITLLVFWVFLSFNTKTLGIVIPASIAVDKINLIFLFLIQNKTFLQLNTILFI